LSSAAIISTNLLPLVKKDADDKTRLAVTRYSIPFVALAASYVAFGAERVVEVLIDSAAPLLAMTIVPFILCFWWQKANRSGALGGIFGGLAGWGIASQFETITPPDLIGFVVSLIIMVVVTLLTQQFDPPRPITDDRGHIVELENRVHLLRRQIRHGHQNADIKGD
jgi:Na+/proline symporter